MFLDNGLAAGMGLILVTLDVKNLGMMTLKREEMQRRIMLNLYLMNFSSKQLDISEPSDANNLDTTESEKVTTESEKKKSELLAKNDMPKPTPPDTLGGISESLPLQSLPMEFGQNVVERNTEIVEKISPIAGLEFIIGSVSLVSSHSVSKVNVDIADCAIVKYIERTPSASNKEPLFFRTLRSGRVFLFRR
ncbi:hypothetical protein ZOSMA_184G00020 [Zostera marina]|uniref:Uncharacterized protein n=1 Tax=Zostera marina TaxID=29655 RepID=A0A0K9PQK7_ZOSMR|nr:hypothetical protein ZOSMA_184G00020 [Zostera marina]